MDNKDKHVKVLQEGVVMKLTPSGWDKEFFNIINSKCFADPLKSLMTEIDNGKKFTPKFKDIFRAYEMCPYNNVKVVFIGQDPYPQADVADGIAFSCSFLLYEQL